ncbi:MAG: YtxH domain-containing protein [Bacteroidales bacterium]|nr:YtxH domain-containing protein [Bacteroidales bacterium]
MKATEILAFVAGAAAATGVTLLLTTDKGKELCKKVSSKMTKEEIDKLIEKLKNRRQDAPSEEDEYVDSIINEVVEDDEPAV